jgi:hypothetical protein
VVTGRADLQSRRLVLEAAELAVLYRRTGGAIPAGFEVVADRNELTTARTSLTGRGVLDTAGEVHRSVVVNLFVLGSPELAIQTRVHYRDLHVRAVHAARGMLGASLMRQDNRQSELCLFPASDLGRELLRAVPDAAVDGVQLERSVAPAALEELSMDVRGMLHGLVVKPGAPTRIAHVLWYANEHGWLGLRSEQAQDGGRLVRLVPVSRLDYSRWIAPCLAEVLQ